MRLIDADALADVLSQFVLERKGLQFSISVGNIINNQPTVIDFENVIDRLCLKALCYEELENVCIENGDLDGENENGIRAKAYRDAIHIIRSEYTKE